MFDPKTKLFCSYGNPPRSRSYPSPSAQDLENERRHNQEREEAQRRAKNALLALSEEIKSLKKRRVKAKNGRYSWDELLEIIPTIHP